jgi:hypothetical protein
MENWALPTIELVTRHKSHVTSLQLAGIDPQTKLYES